MEFKMVGGGYSRMLSVTAKVADIRKSWSTWTQMLCHPMSSVSDGASAQDFSKSSGHHRNSHSELKVRNFLTFG